MKLRSIIAFIVIVTIRCEKLTSEENKRRLAECGQKFLPVLALDTNPVTLGSNLYWLAQIQTTLNGTRPSAGFWISDRHFLTSSQALVTREKKLNGTEPTCNGTKNARIPMTVLNSLQFKLNNNPITVKSAHILHFCSDLHHDKLFHPLLVELDRSSVQMKDYPCLAEKKMESPKGVARAYGLANGELAQRKVNIDKTSDNRWILIEKYYADYDRGGPLVQNIGGKSTVLGLKGSNPSKESGDPNAEFVYFYDLAKLEEYLCEYSGVCPSPEVTTTLEPTTTKPSTPGTVQPTIHIPFNDNSTSPPVTSTHSVTSLFSTVQSRPRPITKMPRKLSSKKYTVSEAEAETEEDEDERDQGDRDFFVDEDFLNGTKRVGWIFAYFSFYFSIYEIVK